MIQEPTEAPTWPHEATEALDGVRASHQLGRVLRVVGGAFLLASASTFLVQRWEQGSDLVRYALLLLHTLLLAAAALFCGLGVKESRGARTFLGLTLGVVPINAAVLGGLLYSRFAQDRPDASSAAEFLWVAPSDTAALLAAVVTPVVLAPALWFAFRTLARPRATRLLVAALIMNGLLVLPWRLPAVTALVAASAAVVWALIDHRWLGRHPAMTTFEGRLARGTLLLPVLLIFGRAIYLYPKPLLDLGALLIALGVVLVAVARSGAARGRLVTVAVAGTVCLAAGWTFWWSELVDRHSLPSEFSLPALLLPTSALMMGLSRAVPSMRALCHTLAVLFASIAIVPNLWIFPGAWTLLACAATGAALLAYGTWARSKVLTLGGALAVLSAVVHQIAGSFSIDQLNHWVVLSALGMLLIIGASYWERYHAVVLRRLRAWKAKASHWDY